MTSQRICHVTRHVAEQKKTRSHGSKAKTVWRAWMLDKEEQNNSNPNSPPPKEKKNNNQALTHFFRVRFLVLWWKGSSPQSTCKWRNMNHKRKICKYTTKYYYFMSTKRRCPLPWKVLYPGSYLQLLTWQLLRKSTDKVWGLVRVHRPRLKASTQV